MALSHQTKGAEVKIGVAYSGKENGKTKDKVIHLDLDEGKSFWQGLTVKVAKVFDLTKLEPRQLSAEMEPHFVLTPFMSQEP